MNFEPLKGLRVLDLTSVVVGPACTWRLGQYGAEIIKVESPEGDLMRGLGGLSPTGQHSGTYPHLNRGKRNVEPAYVPLLICDHVAGEIAAGAILAAVLQKRTSGQGCSVEVPMFETMAAFVLQEHLAQHSFDPPVGPPGDRRLLSPHNKPVKTADGWISFTVNTDAQVRAFLKVTDRQHLLDDARFSSVAGRARNVVEWFEVRGTPLTQKTTEEWLLILRNADLAVQPCHTLESLPRDTHLEAVGLIGFEDHPRRGAQRRYAPRSTSTSGTRRDVHEPS
jgi:crotonobetainyl-CoA:carnitine CoA-transferase CaiB-like acyl-CoA transferase